MSRGRWRPVSVINERKSTLTKIFLIRQETYRAPGQCMAIEFEKMTELWTSSTKLRHVRLSLLKNGHEPSHSTVGIMVLSYMHHFTRALGVGVMQMARLDFFFNQAMGFNKVNFGDERWFIPWTGKTILFYSIPDAASNQGQRNAP
jgi:hypothetical protein